MNASRSTDRRDASENEEVNTTSDDRTADPQRTLAELQAELADMKDRLLRALAEQENIRRRAQRELDEAVRYAASGVARDLLATADSLRRAIESAPDDAESDEVLQKFLAGVSATERALLDAFEKHGIRRIDPQGQPFDPNWHQAMFEVPDSSYPAGTVIEVVQPGYLHYDRLLRPAMVGVARGGRPAMAESGGEERGSRSEDDAG